MINEETLKNLGLVVVEFSDLGYKPAFRVENKKFSRFPVAGSGDSIDSAFLDYVKNLHKENSRLAKIEDSLQVIGYYFGK